MAKPRTPRFSRSVVNEELVYAVLGTDFTACCTVRLGMIYRAAPILAWAIGRSQWTLEDYCERKGFPYARWRPGRPPSDWPVKPAEQQGGRARSGPFSRSGARIVTPQGDRLTPVGGQREVAGAHRTGHGARPIATLGEHRCTEPEPVEPDLPRMRAIKR